MRDKVIGIYTLCVKYEGDTTPYMISFCKKGEDKLFTKVNLELIDEFTSGYPSKQALLDRIAQSTKRKPIDVFILYNRAQTKEINEDLVESTPTVRKLDVIVDDPEIHEVCKKFVNDKYVEEKTNRMDVGDDTIKNIFDRIIHMVEYQRGFDKINGDDYLDKYAAHFKEKLLAHGTYYLNARNQESSNTYPVAKDAFIESYATFRHVYTHLLRSDMKDASIYSTKDPEIKDRKTGKKISKEEYETITNKVVNESIPDGPVEKIQDSFLKQKYIETDGDAEEIFLYLGESFCDELTDYDKNIVFGNYDAFKERMRNEYPDVFGSRGL